ncbi:MAG: RIP metalloprotease RseP [Campylobacteraceae bacterium 4484_166]|nr:MAG: RIP metalloprotease RseP [Campylobacteraceae bacterium 4484_166]
MSTIVVLLVFMFLVFFHELGHFVIAKKMGVTVEKFSIGFGMFGLLKPIFSTNYKGTNYVLYPTLFLGGYVKMKGQIDEKPAFEDDSPDSYTAKKPWQRIAILLGGPVANILLAFFLYLVIAFMGTKAISPTIGKIVENSVASKAGLLVDDKIIKINNTKIQKWADIGEIITNSDKAIKIYVNRGQDIRSFVLNPKLGISENKFKEKIQKRMIGIAPKPILIDINHSFFGAFKYAINSTTEACSLIFVGVGKLIFGSVDSSEVGGVITIASIISDASKAGLVALFSIAALISVNLGILNLLPIPILDGGHIMFNIFEWISGKKPSENALNIFASIGLVVLLSLMILGLFNDINRFF